MSRYSLEDLQDGLESMVALLGTLMTDMAEHDNGAELLRQLGSDLDRLSAQCFALAREQLSHSGAD